MGWRLARRKERPEVGVGRHNDSLFGGSAIKDGGVCGCLHAVVAYVDGVVPGGREALCDHWRERVVDEKSQPASGSSRSRTASAA